MARLTDGQDSPAIPGPWPEAALLASQAAITHLVEGLLHDARNPLNAMAINLEVLGHKLKDGSGTVPPTLERNLRAVHEQVFRVDAILRAFAEFLETRSSQLDELSLVQVLERAREALDHEARKRRVALRMDLEPGLQVRLDDPLALRFLAYHSILRALLRSAPGGNVQIHLRRAGERAELEVRDAGGTEEPDPVSRPALEALGRARSVDVAIQSGHCLLTFPVT